MDINFINVGYGEAIFITHNGKNILVDSGSSLPEEYSTNSRITCKEFLNSNEIKKIDLVILTHIHEDHICGLEEILKSTEILEIWINMEKELFHMEPTIICELNAKKNITLFTKALNSFVRILNFAKENNIFVKSIEYTKNDCQITKLGLEFDFFAPLPSTIKIFTDNLKKLSMSRTQEETTQILTILDKFSNDTSLAFRISDDNFSCVLTADNCPYNMINIDFARFKTDIFKLAHHGQYDCFDLNLMQAANPHFIITSTSSDRKNNSAHKEVYSGIQTIFGQNVEILFTDETDYKPFFKANKDFSWIKFYYADGKLKYTLLSKQNSNKGDANVKNTL